jgi:hypothetical protein
MRRLGEKETRTVALDAVVDELRTDAIPPDLR